MDSMQSAVIGGVDGQLLGTPFGPFLKTYPDTEPLNVGDGMNSAGVSLFDLPFIIQLPYSFSLTRFKALAQLAAVERKSQLLTKSIKVYTIPARLLQLETVCTATVERGLPGHSIFTGYRAA